MKSTWVLVLGLVVESELVSVSPEVSLQVILPTSSSEKFEELHAFSFRAAGTVKNECVHLLKTHRCLIKL